MQASAFEDTRPSDYLMRFAASDLGRSYKSLAVSELAIRAGDVVVDLGCGPGADLAAFAAAVGASGQVIGVDHDPVAVGQARDRTADLPQVDVREADIETLGIPAASVDRVHTDRVLQHVPEPGTALAQARASGSPIWAPSPSSPRPPCTSSRLQPADHARSARLAAVLHR
jgi:ubiquinone/menaquinone biosynthesis C-methylase UbiE